MLYDQRWDAKTKADPFSLESLIAWLEKQPAKKRYDYGNCSGGCLIHQHLIAHGEDWGDYRLFQSQTVRVIIAARRPQTFGAALTRARAVLTERAGA